jgi:hypothetical protein
VKIIGNAKQSMEVNEKPEKIHQAPYQIVWIFCFILWLQFQFHCFTLGYRKKQRKAEKKISQKRINQWIWNLKQLQTKMLSWVAKA